MVHCFGLPRPPNPKEDKPAEAGPDVTKSMVLSDGMKLGKSSKSQ